MNALQLIEKTYNEIELRRFELEELKECYKECPDVKTKMRLAWDCAKLIWEINNLNKAYVIICDYYAEDLEFNLFFNSQFAA